jgi:hypothetical protein
LAAWKDEHYDCGNNLHNHFGRDIAELPIWKRLLFGLVMVIGFPLVLGLIGVALAFGVVAGLIGGFFVGPGLIFAKFQCLQNNFCCLFCPIYALAGIVIGGLAAIGYGTLIGCQIIMQYFLLLK